MKESAFTGGTPSSPNEGTGRGYKELQPRNDAERNICMKIVNERNASINLSERSFPPEHMGKRDISYTADHLTSIRNHHRRGALCEYTMNEDIQNLRYAFIKLNMIYTGIL